jgi:hypothetical protein
LGKKGDILVRRDRLSKAHGPAAEKREARAETGIHARPLFLLFGVASQFRKLSMAG